jgi:drug/metabolite transporter (DMT)-like permease
VILGPAAAFTASVTWAYATTRYARVSRDVGSARVNFMRALVAVSGFTLLRVSRGGTPTFSAMTPTAAGWLLLSIVCSYALGDSLFLTASRRIGITTALSIASTYPLWAALWGTAVDGEPFGLGRAAGTLLAVGGVVWLVRLAAGVSSTDNSRDAAGLALAGVASVMWAANSIGVKRGAVGLDAVDVNIFRFSAGLLLLWPQLRLGAARALPASPTGGWLPVFPALIADAVVGSLAYVYGLSHTDLAVGATLSSLAPLISVPFAIAAGEEPFSARRSAAIVVTVAGIVLLLQS